MPANGYQIRVKGDIRPEWTEWFDDVAIVHERNGATTLTGPVADQSALHGLLHHIKDLGLRLLSFQQEKADTESSD